MRPEAVGSRGDEALHLKAAFAFHGRGAQEVEDPLAQDRKVVGSMIGTRARLINRANREWDAYWRGVEKEAA
ncbi:MAG: hypothetical protein J5X22_04275 [Candidatus Accumulibacter sp.]|nr:hypothetical protein [Accumulibacter sp.]